MMMFNPSREDARQFYFETWHKHQQKLPLVGAELIAIDIMLAHPEYHALLSQPERFESREYSPELGETNPFLHLSMHLAIQEQLSIDQPAGIRKHYQALLHKHQDAMTAQHEIMDCLAEMIWQAQRQQTAFDPAIYFACLKKKIR
ncbi:hypothetical protein CAP31_02900 [Sulfuriferula sp. AH1]|nr:hypothetical protein CAP31_02900 [Sulfuriferula sp. AH1]